MYDTAVREDGRFFSEERESGMQNKDLRMLKWGEMFIVQRSMINGYGGESMVNSRWSIVDGLTF